VLGRSVAMLSPKRLLARDGLFPGNERRVMKNAEEKVGLRKDGKEFHAELSYVAWTAGGKQFYGSIIRDITERKKAEAALRESEEKLRLIIENTMDVIYTTSPDGVMTYISPQVSRWGRTPEALVGRELMDLIHPDDVARVLTEFQETKGEGLELPISFRLVTKSGQQRHLEASSKAIWTDGELSQIVGVIRDVTERVKVEEALRARDEKYRLLAANVTDIIWTTDLDLKYTFVSPSVTKLRGFTPEEVMTQSMDEVLTPDSAELARKIFKGALVEERKGKGDPKRSYILEVEMTLKGGGTVWAEIVAGFLRNEKGEPVGILGVTRDITQRRRAAAELREKSELLEAVINTVSDGIFALDDQGNYVLINPASGEKVGQDPQEWLGKRAGSTLHPDDVGKCIENFLEALGGEERRFEARVQAPGGKYRLLEIKLNPMTFSGKRHVLGVVSDITDRKK